MKLNVENFQTRRLKRIWFYFYIFFPLSSPLKTKRPVTTRSQREGCLLPVSLKYLKLTAFDGQIYNAMNSESFKAETFIPYFLF